MSILSTLEADIRPPLWIPRRLEEQGIWWGHVPFAFWIVAAVRPRTLVDLAAGRGLSETSPEGAPQAPAQPIAYPAFCEAVARLGLATRCVAVAAGRPGEGGSSAGGEGLEAFTAGTYGTFAQVRTGDLDAAAGSFADGSVDVLHLAGSQDYDTLRRHFEAWRLKLSASAVLLLDGTNGGSGAAGARRLFDELARTAPSFEFLHAGGLGVVALGADPAVAVGELAGLRQESAIAAARRAFAELGEVWAGVSAARREAARRDDRIAALESALAAASAAGAALRQERDDLLERSHKLTEDHEDLLRLCRSMATQRDDMRGQVESLSIEARHLREERARAVEKAERLQYHNGQLWLMLETAEKLIASISDRYNKAVRENTVRWLKHKLKFAFRKLPVRRGRYRIIADSAFFDAEYYLETNKDLAPTVDPVLHYIVYGANERRSPSRFFSERRYQEIHPDVAEAGLSAIEHYEKFGRRHGSHLLLDMARAGAAGVDPRRLLRASVAAAGAEEAAGEDGPPVPMDDPPPSVVTRRLTVTALREPRAGAAVGRPLVLYLTHVPPWPVRAGNEYGTQRMIAWLERRGFDVVLLYCPLPGEGPDEAGLRELMDYCPNLVWISREGEVRHALARPDLVAAATALDGVSDRPDRAVEPTGRWADTQRTFCPDALATVAQALDRALAPAMVVANYIWTSRSLPLMRPGVVKAIQTHDVFSSLGGKVLEFGISHGLAMAPEEEAAMLERADLVLAVQPEEAEELRRITRGPTVLHVGIDMDVAGTAGTPDRPTVLLIGSGNAMNVKGLRDFLRFSWPRIRAAIPEAELQVAGSVGRAVPYGAEGVRALGFIDDLAPVYAGARLVINPAVAGTGIKIKTLEAMAHLRPLVTWPSGVDGVAPELRALCDVVTDWHQFTEAVIRLLRDDGAAERVVAARPTVERLLSPDQVFLELARELDRRLGVPSPEAVAE